MALQKAPRGLSDLLGLYRQGQVPLEYSGFINLNLNAEQWLAEPKSARAQANHTAAGGATTIIMPKDEIWLIWALSVYTLGPVAVGDKITVAPAINWANNTGALYFTAPNTHNFNAGDYVGCGSIHPNGLWAPPGSNINGYVLIKGTLDIATIYLDCMYSAIKI